MRALADLSSDPALQEPERVFCETGQEKLPYVIINITRVKKKLQAFPWVLSLGVLDENSSVQQGDVMRPA